MMMMVMMMLYWFILRQLCAVNSSREFSHMKTRFGDKISEILDINYIFTQLIARDDFIEFSGLSVKVGTELPSMPDQG
jgi:hypothetical protein